MPLEKNVWNLGKCALKALQYMACGVPCIATPWGAVRDVIQHDVNGLFADNTREWTAAIERLRDPGMRSRIAAAGRETVCERFSLSSAAPRLLELLRSVA
jgi:glycosyltransferase involved in cell wall biosynthesis